MKKSTAVQALGIAYLMAAVQEQDIPIVKQGNIHKGGLKLKPKEFKIPTFKEEAGVLKTIDEYKLIQSDQSKQGPRKQARTLAKIKNWLDKGLLTEEDLKSNKL